MDADAAEAADRRLLAAADAGDAAGVVAALADGALSNCIDGGGYTPLIRLVNCALWTGACLPDHVTAARALLAAGADPDCMTASARAAYGDRSLLTVAASQPCGAGIAIALIQGGADVHEVAVHTGTTALHCAASPAVVRALVAAGAELHALSKFGLTPLHSAANDGRAEVVAALLACGADPLTHGTTNTLPVDLARVHLTRYVVGLPVVAPAQVPRFVEAVGQYLATMRHLLPAGAWHRRRHALAAWRQAPGGSDRAGADVAVVPVDGDGDGNGAEVPYAAAAAAAAGVAGCAAGAVGAAGAAAGVASSADDPPTSSRSGTARATMEGPADDVAAAASAAMCRRELAQQLYDAAAAGDAGRLEAALAAGTLADMEHQLDVSLLQVVLQQGCQDGVTSGHEECVRLLLRAGASANAESMGMTPLAWAATCGTARVVADVLEHGGNPREAAPLVDDEGCVIGGGAGAASVGATTAAAVAAVAAAAQQQHDWALHVAAADGDAARVRAALAAGAAVDSLNRQGNTPLLAAFERGFEPPSNLASGHEHCVHLLLRAGASANAEAHNKTPLWWAARLGNPALLQEVLDHGGDPRQASSETGTTPLHSSGSGDAVRLLVAAGGDVNARSWSGTTPLHDCDHLDLNVLQALLDHGADCSEVDDFGDTPLDMPRMLFYEQTDILWDRHWSDRRKRSKEVTRMRRSCTGLLLLVAADAWQRRRHLLLAVRGRFAPAVAVSAAIADPGPVRSECTSAASRTDAVRGVAATAAAGADADVVDAAAAFDAHLQLNWELQEAALEGDADRMRAALDAGAVVDTVDYDGDTPLLVLLRKGMHDGLTSAGEECARLLLQVGACTTIENMGMTPLAWAAAARRPSVLADVLRHGGDARWVSTADGATPMHYTGSSDAVQQLQAAGADVNAHDWYGRTPLHAAEERGNAEVIQALLDHGADSGAVDAAGFTPLGSAMQFLSTVAAGSLRGTVGIQAEAVRRSSVMLLLRAADAWQRRRHLLLAVRGRFVPAASFGFDLEESNAWLVEAAAAGSGGGGGGAAGAASVGASTAAAVAAAAAAQQQLDWKLQDAATDGDAARVREALAGGAAVDSVDRESNTPLLAALQIGCYSDLRSTDEECISLLLRAGASANVDNEAMTPVTWAAAVGNPHVLADVLRHGGDARRASMRDGTTALHHAHFGDAVRQLVAAGGAVHARDHEGRTPLHCLSLQTPDVLQAILDHGADCSAEDARGQTPVASAWPLFRQLVDSVVAQMPVVSQSEAASRSIAGGVRRYRDCMLLLVAADAWQRRRHLLLAVRGRAGAGAATTD